MSPPPLRIPAPPGCLSSLKPREPSTRLVADATQAVRSRVVAEGRISSALMEAEQHACHGLAWLATYAETVRELAAYGERLSAEGRYGEIEELLVAIGAGEYLAQIFGGMPMSQGEIVRLPALGLSPQQIAARQNAAVTTLIAQGNTPAHRARLVDLMRRQPGRRDHRRSRPRRDARGDPRGNAQVRGERSAAPCP